MSQNPKTSSKQKARQPKLRCFVAMAIGRDDTDAVYEGHIKKAIEAANMTPIRVDRIVHIDRIDAKIREEIMKADILVADLTYARPSVYWEAGYAERESPVIYTCRSDHLRPKPEDKQGNYQVHFDLRNAKIITWSESGSSAFQEELRTTLLYAARSIRGEKEKEEQKILARKEFSRKSQAEQRRAINTATDDAMQSFGYSSIPMQNWLFVETSGGGGTSYPTFWKQVESTAMQVSSLGCTVSLKQKELERQVQLWQFNLDEFATWEGLPGLIARLTRRRIKGFRRVILIPVLLPVPPTRIANACPYWRRIGPFLHYYFQALHEPAATSKKPLSLLPSSLELLVLDKIGSLLDYHEALSRALDIAENNKTPIIFPRTSSSQQVGFNQ